MVAFEAWLVFLILVVNVVGELQRKRTLAASRGFLAAARLSCCFYQTVYIFIYSAYKLQVCSLNFCVLCCHVMTKSSVQNATIIC